ncbi:Pyruvate decarboxylase isozyme 2 [Cocos nucifera]|uniref:pyruvate decarboxylase n=1 Tax=Cocos nucifera TaxID=13894 RepID=A0A8K0IRX0_COCNU|nr:Pyruvate decarboxylase isozyme 2 [Cocos nucifera]
MDTSIGTVHGVGNDVGSISARADPLLCTAPCGAQRTVSPHATPICAPEATLGRHLACRLVQVGVNDVFSVPGDFNLTLLDHRLAEPGLNLVGCCNELNAGYAADGYARSRGVGACVVTFTVGSLSVLNAIAGAYSENLPVICIVGGPNSNDYGTNRILHQTIGLPDFSQELRCFRTVTCYQMTAQDVSTMMRCKQNSIIFLINNGGYTVEAAIHDGPYNVVKNWNHTALVDPVHNGEGKCWTTKVRYEEELKEAIQTALGRKGIACAS